MKKLHVKLIGLLDGLQTSEHDPVRYYFDMETGEVIDILVPDLLGEAFDDPDRGMVEGDPERYRRVPNVPGRTQYRWMEEFVDGLEETDVADKLRIALAGRGAFGRFREVISQWPDLKQRWYATRQQALVDEAIHWLEALGLDPDYELPGPDSPPPQSTRSREPRVSLVHVLVMAPLDPSTDPASGSACRLVRAEDAGSARTIFKALAREWCEMRGVGWRKRFVEGKDVFELEGLTLRLAGEQIQVQVVVPADVARLLLG